MSLGARTIKPRSTLADLDTNGLILPKKISRKSKTGRVGSDLKVRKAVSESTSGRANPTTVVRQVTRSVVTDQYLPADSHSIRPSQRNFVAFPDIENRKTLASPSHLPQPRTLYESSSQPGTAGYQTNPSLVRGTGGSGDWYSQLRSYPKTPDRSEALERLPTEPKSQVHGAPTSESVGRITQRYFSVSGSEEPQFFTTMPPQMEFGGMAGPKYRGATLNPLNPYLRQARLRTSHL